jgi:hypothetical protein
MLSAVFPAQAQDGELAALLATGGEEGAGVLEIVARDDFCEETLGRDLRAGGGDDDAPKQVRYTSTP